MKPPVVLLRKRRRAVTSVAASRGQPCEAEWPPLSVIRACPSFKVLSLGNGFVEVQQEAGEDRPGSPLTPVDLGNRRQVSRSD